MDTLNDRDDDIFEQGLVFIFFLDVIKLLIPEHPAQTVFKQTRKECIGFFTAAGLFLDPE